MTLLHSEFALSIQSRELNCPSLLGYRSCKLAPGPIATPQHLQIDLFSCLLLPARLCRSDGSKLTNQRSRPTRRIAGGLSVNPELPNHEPVDCYNVNIQNLYTLLKPQRLLRLQSLLLTLVTLDHFSVLFILIPERYTFGIRSVIITFIIFISCLNVKPYLKLLKIHEKVSLYSLFLLCI